MARLGELEEGGRVTPVIQDGGVTYIYVQHTNLYLLAVTRTNTNAAAILLFLHRLVTIFKHYFQEVSGGGVWLGWGCRGRWRGGAALQQCLADSTLGEGPAPCPPPLPTPLHAHNTPPPTAPSATLLPPTPLPQLEEESLRDNFVIAYELLDEVMDYGFPQFTEAAVLSEFIKTDAHKMAAQARPPMAVTNAVSWRSEGLHYKKNEVFLDVVESVNLLVNSNGTVVRSEVVGALKMRAYLSGMPECKLGLNDRMLFEAQGRAAAGRGQAVDLEDMKFHQCVRLASFERDRTISFIPPDGAFDLM